MKILLTNGKIQTVTNEKGRELIANGLSVEYTGNDPEQIAVREALAVPEKAAERVEVVHYHVEAEPEKKKKKSKWNPNK